MIPSQQPLNHQPIHQIPTQQMYSEYIPLNTQQAYYQQPLPQQQHNNNNNNNIQQQQQQSPQQPQQHQQVINPNLNSNTNNNVPTDTREASAFSFPKRNSTNSTHTFSPDAI